MAAAKRARATETAPAVQVQLKATLSYVVKDAEVSSLASYVLSFAQRQAFDF